MPNWKKLVVESNLPASLTPLKEISQNLWWCWNTEARLLFKKVSTELWEELEHNPIHLLNSVSYERLTELANDKVFVAEMDAVKAKLDKYLEERSNYTSNQIAYFSMEYGLHDSLKIFSGGLGILAGDYLKEASDSKLNLSAVGLLYRYGYFKQQIDMHGQQMANYDAQEFSRIPVLPVTDADGNFIEVEVEYPGRNLKARVWETKVGAVNLYLLDADYEANSDEDRFVTHHLYGGDNENRLKQEMLLGLGGIRALRKIGIKNADLYHCNEGHAAFIGLERIKDIMAEEGLTYAEAKEVVRASTLFTTHTPVPAGHDSFHQDLFGKYMSFYKEQLGLSWDEFVNLGKANPSEDKFNMSYLACNMSQGVNGVSWLHGEVSKEILKDMYPEFMKDELAIGYVTNGVHYPTWAAPDWKKLHLKYFGEDFAENQLDFARWEKIYDVPNKEIWEVKKKLKQTMISYIRERFTQSKIKTNENPKFISDTMNQFNPNALTIGFARRFATYKRAHLLFRNLDRLAKIVNNPNCPVQFVFAGKAHPADGAGQGLIKYIYEISKRPEFLGKIIFVQNYDMDLAKKMVQGVDIWLNTPTRPLEASGTSGEKAAMNGTMHFSVLDGWWVEGYKENAGWMLPLERTYENQDLQDELDAETIYNTFENDIVPKYYNRGNKEYSDEWVKIIKNTIAQVAPNFTMARMVRDYVDRFYTPQSDRHDAVAANGNKLAKELAAWKENIKANWDAIKVVDARFSDGSSADQRMKIGETCSGEVHIALGNLKHEEVGVELVINSNDDENPVIVTEFDFTAINNGVSTYCIDFPLNNPGIFDYGIRVYAKHPALPHRQDFQYIFWI
ncbi:MAG: alpha-glucan family phosphorylase [Mangrovibacterium sp.]